MIENNFHKAHWQMYYDVKYFSNYLTVLWALRPSNSLIAVIELDVM